MDINNYFSEVRLKRMSLAVQQEISDHILDPRMDFDVVGAMSNHFIASIRGFIWGTDQETVVARYPANTWQMFKHNWFPDWMKLRFPVKYNEIICKVDALFPTLRVMVPDHEPVLRLTVCNSSIDNI